MMATQMSQPKPETYSTPFIALHWFMAVLIAAVFATIELREYFPKGSDPREQLKALHFMLGLSVLLLVVLRIILRAREADPPIVPPMATAQKAIALGLHLALYAVMLVMPILGWVTLSAAGKPVPFFGLTLPALVAENKELAENLKEAHEFIGTIFYYLIGIHILAALFHHYARKDNTLTRMLLPRS